MAPRPSAPTGAVGPGPPEEQRDGSRRLAADGAGGQPQSGTASEGQLCGPHQSTPHPATDTADSTVTTPSDAQQEGPPQEEVTTEGEKGGSGAAGQQVQLDEISYAAAVSKGRPPADATCELPPVSKITGNWKPRERDNLLATLAKAWNEQSRLTITEDMKALRKAAMVPTELRRDDALRPRTEAETQALLAYLNGELELPHAPIFLKATMPLMQRAMLEQFHETHVEAGLTAEVSPSAKLRKSMTHLALFRLLYQANSDTERGRIMIKRMMDEVKVLQFDGSHTISFVFYSRRVAAGYRGVALRLQGTYLELEDSESASDARVLFPAQLRRVYSVRVYNAGAIGLVTLVATLSKLPGVTILDAERPRTDSTEIVDNRYVTIHFQDHDWPLALQGVTKIKLGDTVITVHHHLLQPRLPCSRCYAPFHTIGYCRTHPTHLDRVQRKHKRSYEGAVPRYSVGEAVQYRHSDQESLTVFLTTLQSEMEAEMKASGQAQLSEDQTIAGPALEEATKSPTQADPNQEGAHPSAGSASLKRSGYQSDDSGFHTARSKSAKARANALQKKEANVTAAKDKGKGKAPHGQDQEAGHSQTGAPHPAAKTNRKGRNGKGQRPNPQGFASFNRERARGRYAELTESSPDSDSELESSVDEDNDEAPYAYAEPTQPTEAPGETAEPKAVDQTTVTLAGPDQESASAMQVDSDGNSSISGYVGSSGPSQSESFASTPGSEFPYSLASDNELQGDEPIAAEDSVGQTLVRDGIEDTIGGQEDSPRDAGRSQQDAGRQGLSQEGFVLEKTQYPSGMPQQLPTFLGPFSGSLITVPANGQCAYAALFATTSYVDGGVLHFTSEVVRGTNALKRSVYTLMMANLAKDVACGVVDPRRELQRLYPRQPTPMQLAAATATLYGHYAQERARSVNTHIPSEFWAGAEVLRAMAQYLREPLFVFDVSANNDTHVQRYYYKTYEMETGGAHETGCGGAITDAMAKEFFEHSARLHVLPVMLALKRHEGHFYGVHHGSISTRWQAEGDRTFAEMNCSTHPWFEEVIAHMEYSAPRLPELNMMEDSGEADMVIIGGLEHRDRLDIVHDRLGLPRLNADGFDITSLADKLRGEGERLQQAAGLPAPVQTTGVGGRHEVAADRSQRRFPITPQGRVALAPVQRILDSIKLEPELLADRNKLRQLLQANAAAMKDWRHHLKASDGGPQAQEGQRGLVGLMPWLLQHRDELHRLFRQLPYPELAAKQLPPKLLQQWGALEAYDVQVATLRGVINDPDSSTPAVEHCRAWVAACTIRHGDAQDRKMAGDRQQWDRLLRLCPQQELVVRPDDISAGGWNILHTLQYSLWAWKATSIGQAPKAHLGHHYRSQPAISRLCELVEERAEWGAAAEIPSGITWDDRLTAMEAGLSAQPRY